jgi:heme oxygenase
VEKLDMTSQEIAAIVSVARRAPLTNMNEAEAVAQLLQKLINHFAPKPAESEVADTIEK